MIKYVCNKCKRKFTKSEQKVHISHGALIGNPFNGYKDEQCTGILILEKE